VSDPIVYQIQIPAPYADDVTESVKEAAGKATGTDDYKLTGKVQTVSTSEIQFDPVTIAAGIWVGHLVLNSVASLAVEEMARTLLKKMRNRKGKGEAPKDSPMKLVLILPDTSKVELVVDDPGTEAKLRALAVPKP
jgi:hypothetical protein